LRFAQTDFDVTDSKKSKSSSVPEAGVPNTGARDKGPALAQFHPAVREWFEACFETPTRAQQMGWPAIGAGESTLISAPTGTGKTLAAFLFCINRLMFAPVPDESRRCRVVYISPIKALAVDVERNLRAPLIGIAQAAKRLGIEVHLPTVAIRTGDTTPAERARFVRHPADILITTPESLYLLLTTRARDALRPVETVIVDEIHALVPGKRGSHLALSLERLEHLCQRQLQRIGLSATQRPLEEVAHYLGGTFAAKEVVSQHTDTGQAETSDSEQFIQEVESGISARQYRPVTIIDASELKQLSLRVEVPVEDMSRLDELQTLPSGPASQGPIRPSIWSAIHPKLLELVRSHRSTLIFVNSRRLAERISGAINELAGETLVRAHHGSVALEQRKDIEDRLKLGTLRGLVATSSLELGIDMGAIDLVVQIESPPSVASGIQRIGRASHHVGAVSNGIIYPKYRADLLACAAASREMYEGHVEAARYPRNPLDVLAQQIVAAVAIEDWDANELFALVRSAAPYAALTRPLYESVLDMLSGRYPSDEFSELRPRLTWDRISNKLTARQGARSVAIINGGTIPDRGLYGVFLAGVTRGGRVGELDEEMVFESRTGDTIILGASTWRIDEILHDRVVVSPAPGEPGKMPFWHGDAPGRPAEFGERIGRMSREILRMPHPAAFTQLIEKHSLDENAADNLLRYLTEQVAATGRLPSDEDIVIETCRDELGDRRICVLTPFGSRVHMPWCMAVVAKLRAERGWEVESMWSEDGFVIRLPENEEPVDTELLLPSPAELKELVLRQLGSTSLFAAKFREAAARALLLPKRRPGMRRPLWQQRKRAADLLAVASRFSSFPIILESYRECIRDSFDLPAASEILAKIQKGAIRVTSVTSEKPSPFAAALLFSYVANYIYDGDAPLAERRAQALSIDLAQLEELFGESDLRELLDAGALSEVEARLQWLDPDYRVSHPDGVHDLLLRLGDLSPAEVSARAVNGGDVAGWLQELVNTRRILKTRINLGNNGMNPQERYIPVEYASRYRDIFGIALPPGLPEVFTKSTEAPLKELLRRYARTHGPFTSREVAERFGLATAEIEPILHTLHADGNLLEGEFRPGGSNLEWCDGEVLQQIRRKSLAKLRREVEPVEQKTFARFTTRWQGVTAKRRGLDALLDSIEVLQGAPLLASELEREIFRSRIADYQQGDLDALMAAGEVVWVGLEQIGPRDGRIALYLTESMGLLLPKATAFDPSALSERARQIISLLEARGAVFYSEIQSVLGGFPRDTTDALWELVWAGQITNDTFHPIRNFLRPADSKRNRQERSDGLPGSPEYLRRIRSRQTTGGPAQGRWSLIRQRITKTPTQTEWASNTARQLLVRHGVVMRETAAAENISGGYSNIYPVFKTMEESGWAQRGMFVAGLGAAQFATPAAVDLLRSMRAEPANPEALYLAASDPANPHGTLFPWPRTSEDAAETEAHHAMSRTRGAGVILINGELIAFLRRNNPNMKVFLPAEEPERSSYAQQLAKKLAALAVERQGRRSGLLIATINNQPAREHLLARLLEDAGFVNTALGFQMRRVSPLLTPALQAEPIELEDSETDADSDSDPEAEANKLSESA
jgi:ATP-dependent helicase Lhr and Lhr-like helicase